MNQIGTSISSFDFTKIGKHLLLWLAVYIVYSAMLYAQAGCLVAALANLVTVPIYMLAYYFLRYVQLPLFYVKKRYWLFLLSLVLSTVFLFALNSIAWRLWLNDVVGNAGNTPFFNWNNYILKSVRFYSPAMALILLESLVTGKSKRIRIRELENEKVKNELKYLKARVNPQFVSTTLNNLNSHVIAQSPKAPEMILGLSNILDYALYRSQRPVVALTEELEAIQNLINLERIRLGNDVKIDVIKEGDFSILIPPLLLFTTIEHLFKQEQKFNSGQFLIEIFAKKTDRKVRLNIKNTVLNQQENRLTKIRKLDISNIEKRLALLYPEKHRILIEEIDNGYCFSLTIQIAE